MTRHGQFFMRMAVLAMLALGTARTAQAADAAQVQANQAARITAVETSPDGRLAIRGTAKPSFTVFKMTEPSRLVIDLTGSDVTKLASPLAVKLDGVRGVTAAQFDEGSRRVARLVVGLDGDVKYDVTASGNDLFVAIKPQVAAATQAPKAELAQTAVTAPAADSNVVLQKDDVKKVAHPAKKLAGVAIADKAGAQRVSVKTDGEVGKYTLIELKDPARLALDLSGVEGKSATLPGKGAVKSVRVAKHDGGVRVVVDGAGDKMPSYEIERRADGLEVRIGEVAVAKAPASTPAKIEAARPEPVKAAPTAVAAIEGSKIAVAPSVIKAVDLRLIEGKTEVAVLIDGAYQFETSRVGTNTAVLTLKGVTLPERLERKLDAKELNAGVEMLTSYRVPGQTNEVRIVASLKNAVKADAQADKTGVRWTFEEQQKLAAVLPLAQTATTKAAAAASEAKAQTNNGNVLDDKNYTGRRVDFNVKDIDIKNLLNAIADISKKNVIVADDVKGTVSIKLRNVPWDQALDIILKSKGLGKEEIGNIIRVAPLERLRAEQKEAAEAKKVQQTFEPLKVRLVSVNYATASGMADKIKDTLSDRGTVSVDTRTNTLIIKDVQEALLRAEAIVRNLDTQTPEVLIESRIVEASTTFSRQVGIQWGGNVAFGPSTGNPTGLVFPSILQVAGAADDANGSSNGLGTTQPNFAVNMPAPIGAGAGGGVGFTFGSAGGAANLNLRLSAAESNGTLKTISSPRVVALDSVESTIGQGVSIPFSQVSAAGVNTTFIDAKLELKVQVHVTQEGSIQMKISATNNQPNSQLTGANGQPSLSKREAKTEVLVKDGDTTVIGGIYTRSTSESWKEVPFLSKIPILGWLFKTRSNDDSRNELLIFITPRIINRSQSTVASAAGADAQ